MTSHPITRGLCALDPYYISMSVDSYPANPGTLVLHVATGGAVTAYVRLPLDTAEQLGRAILEVCAERRAAAAITGASS